MLQVNPRKSRVLTGIEKYADGIEAVCEYGKLKISFVRDDIVRVRFTQEEKWAERENAALVYEEEKVNWKYSESDEEICLSTKEMNLFVAKKTGSITYTDKDGKLLFAEKEKESRILEGFDSYKMVIDENVRVERIETPDGIKERIVEASRVYDKKLYKTKWNINYSKDEALFGLGQSPEGSFNLRGTTQYLHQANQKIAVPFMVSTRNYGIMLNTYAPAVFSDTQYGTYFSTQADPEMDAFIIAGASMDDVIKGYRYLTGKAVMLPAWAYGFVQSLERYETAQELEDTVEEFRKRHVGIDCIVLDWDSWEPGMWGQKTFDPARFPDPAAMMDNLHENNAHLMVSIWPNMDKKCRNFDEFNEAELLLPASNIYDAYNEEARKLYWKQVNEGIFKYGIDAFWCDSSEPFTPEWSHAAKPEPSAMYEEFYKEASNYMPAELTNSYGIYHARALYEGWMKEETKKRVTNLTRNGYLGGQRYGTILWSGDIAASWETFRNQIKAGQNFCASGLPYWTLDCGAFFVKPGVQWFWEGEYPLGNKDNGYRELYTRWYQYCAFLPVFRSHGTDTRREIWNFGEPGTMFYDAQQKANKMRYELLPYWYSLGGLAYLEDKSIMKPLAFCFKEKAAVECGMQFMVGDSMMVCPVTEPIYYEADSKELKNTSKKQVCYLPDGCGWYDYNTKKYYEGGQYVSVDADIDTIPVFIKAGSIIPRAEYREYASAALSAPVTLEVYAGADGECVLYHDAEDGEAYKNGEYSLVKYSWDEYTHALNKEKLHGCDKVNDYNIADTVIFERK